MTDFLNNKKHRVVLNGQNSPWTNVGARISQGFFLGPLLFFIYITDLLDNLASNLKLFVDGTSFFSVVKNLCFNASNLNSILVSVEDEF